MVTFRHDSPGRAAGEWELDRVVTEVDLAGVDRVVVLAAHPDDETLGAAGLIAHAHAAGLEVVVVVATDGEASHPRSPTHTTDQLATRRRAELRAAVDVLAQDARIEPLALPDGRVADHEDELVRSLVELVGDGGTTLVVAPWRHDGHTDHEAAGRAAAAAAVRTGAGLLEYPVWFWHWGGPADAPWAEAERLDLDSGTRRAKRDAVAAHRSQVATLSDRPGDEALLSPDFLAHFDRAQEIYWRQPVRDDALEDLHADHDDPWGVDHRWYEQRKRAILLAMLPRHRFHHAVEVGCSTGALAEGLATRTDALLAIDASPSAVRRAADRLAGHGHVDVRLAHLPEDWPAGRFDLVVLSEVGYFLSPVALDRLLADMTGCLAEDAVVVACHWRHEIVGYPLDGPDVHAAVRRAFPPAAEYRDRDVEILVCCDLDRLPDPWGGP